MGEDKVTKDPPHHPYFCDDCGKKAVFSIPGCGIYHASDCERLGENAEDVFRKAVEYCQRTGKAIP